MKVYFKFGTTAEELRDIRALQCLKTSKWLAKERAKFNGKKIVNTKIHPCSRQRRFIC